jgi:hypothetical protein
MAYNTPFASKTQFGVVEVGTNIDVVTGVIDLPQSVAVTANPTFATLTSTGAVTDTGNRVITTLTAGTGITITGAAPSLTINATPTPAVATRLVAATGPILTTDYYVGVIAAAPVTLTLPAGVDGDEYVVKSEFGNLGNVTVVGNVIAETVEGLVTPAGFVLNFASNASATFIFRGTNWNVV